MSSVSRLPFFLSSSACPFIFNSPPEDPTGEEDTSGVLDPDCGSEGPFLGSIAFLGRSTLGLLLNLRGGVDGGDPEGLRLVLSRGLLRGGVAERDRAGLFLFRSRGSLSLRGGVAEVGLAGLRLASLGRLRGEIDLEGLRTLGRLRGGVLLPAGLRRLRYLRGGDLERLRDLDEDVKEIPRRRRGIMSSSLYLRPFPRLGGGVGEGDLGRRLRGSERVRDRDREKDARRLGVGGGESEGLGDLGLRASGDALRGGVREDRELATREGDRLLEAGGDLYRRGGERDLRGVMERERRRGDGERRRF